MIPIKLFFPPVGMRALKTIIAILVVLTLGELINIDAPVYALFAAVLTMRDTVANSVSFGIARIISILIGGSLGLAYLALGVNTLPPYFSIPLLCAGAFLALYSTLLIKNTSSTAYALLMLFIVYFGSTGHEYEDIIRRIVETVAGIVVAVLINKFINFKSVSAPSDREQQ